MITRKICGECGNVTYGRYPEIPEEEIKFEHCNLIYTAKAKRRDDAFYEITTGRFAGNFVHIWNIIK